MGKIGSMAALSAVVAVICGCASTLPPRDSAQAPDAEAPSTRAMSASGDTDPGNHPAGIELHRSDSVAILPAGQGVLIDNPYGDVRLRFGGYEHALEVHAVVQEPAGGPAIALAPGEQAGRYTVAPRLPAGAILADRQRVDLTVFVPEGHAVEVRTERGLIESRSIRADLNLHSNAGNIAVRGTVGSIQAQTGAGTIEAALEPPAPDSHQRLSTSTGNIVLAIAEPFDAQWQLATSGVFATEFSLDVQPQPGQEPNKKAIAVTGEAKAEVVVESRRGEIRLLRRSGFTPAHE